VTGLDARAVPADVDVLDVVTREIVKNALASIADEMALTVIRTAHSQVVRDTMDFATVLFGPGGEVVAQGATLPFHLGAMPDAMSALLAKFDGDIHPGDVFILNDPDEGGMHLPDIFLMQPIFDGSERIGFAGITAHQADIGGRVPGGNAADSTEIFQEGLQIPLLKLYDGGRENRAIVEILSRNVRVPELVLGDVRAQLAAASTAERRLLQLAARYGRRELVAYMAQILDATEAHVASQIESMPDGEYEFRDFVDDDGLGSGPLAIAVRLTVSGAELVVDFDGSSAQVPSALNATMSIVKAAVYTALMSVMDTSTGLTCNDGFTRPIRVRAPSGCILNPRRPAARAARGLTAYRVVDAVLGALHQIVPDRVPAAGDGGVTVVAFGTTDADGRSAVLVDTPVAGWGGRPEKDGIDGISSLAANMANTPVEVMEAEFPVRIEEYGFVPDTGGAGRFRGCVSVVRQYRLLADEAVLQIRSDRREFLPYGLAGGSDGTPSSVVLNPGENEVHLPSKVTRRIRRDDVVRVVVAGGAGYGDPAQRDPGAVARDVAEELLSPARAERLYGFRAPRNEENDVDEHA
jgi:N-methylhydantoinase B